MGQKLPKCEPSGDARTIFVSTMNRLDEPSLAMVEALRKIEQNPSGLDVLRGPTKDPTSVSTSAPSTTASTAGAGAACTASLPTDRYDLFVDDADSTELLAECLAAVVEHDGLMRDGVRRDPQTEEGAPAALADSSPAAVEDQECGEPVLRQNQREPDERGDLYRGYMELRSDCRRPNSAMPALAFLKWFGGRDANTRLNMLLHQKLSERTNWVGTCRRLLTPLQMALFRQEGVQDLQSFLLSAME